MSEQDLEYLPEQFRDSARLNHDSAEVAGALARRVGSVSPAANQFGGGEAATFASSLDSSANDHSQRAQRAGDGRDAIGEGASATATIGEENDHVANAALAAAESEAGRAVADGI